MKGDLRSALGLIVLCLTTATIRSAAAQARNVPGEVDACSLLTKEIAAAALGEPVKGPTPSGQGLSMGAEKASACEYTGSGLHKVNLNLMQFSPGTAAMYRSLCAEKSKQGLTGLGDTACWYSDKHGELQVLKGTTFFSIELRVAGDPTEAIKRTAKSVFEQLR